MSAAGISQRAVAVPLAGALALVGVCTPLLDDPGWASAVLRTAALLLAVAVAAAVDEPDARMLDASPTTFARRVGARLLVITSAVAPLAAVAGWWGTRANDLPVSPLLLELGALTALALALAASLRRWTPLPEPALVTGPALLVGMLLVRWLAPYLPDPRLTTTQTWWLLLATGAAGCAVALRDPATAGRYARSR